MPAARYAKKKGVRGRPTAPTVFAGVEQGHPVVLAGDVFLNQNQRDPSWDSIADGFIRLNEASWRELDLTPHPHVSRSGIQIRVQPGRRIGAVPLNSPVTGKVVAGLVIQPRFGWSGIGSLLQRVGWQHGPSFASLENVPGSGREVPPWVIAGPAFERILEMIEQLPVSFRAVERVVTSPRGRIDWKGYSKQLARSTWHHLPCEFNELGPDITLLGYAQWALARLVESLHQSGAVGDPIALELQANLQRLLQGLRALPEVRPNLADLKVNRGMASPTMVRGLEAIAWIADRRGLGGGHERDGLAWSLDVAELWEAYVGAMLAQEARSSGWQMRTASDRGTTIPIAWQSRGTMRSLMPDFVLKKGDEIRVVDAKYKSHFVDLSSRQWHEFGAAAQGFSAGNDSFGARSLADDHRADLHQILAYAGLMHAKRISAELVYPLRRRDASPNEIPTPMSATLPSLSEREVTLTLRALPFG